MTDININQFSEALNDKADRDLGNLASPEGENHFTNLSLNNTSYTTNRILEIPQHIKLELNSGTLTLKAGSKICRPNFGIDNVTTIGSDLTQSAVTPGLSGQFFVYAYGREINSFGVKQLVNNAGSGSSLPTDNSNYNVFFLTTDNTLWIYGNNSWAKWNYSLPLGIVTATNGAITSIDQVFNGFGYIGSTAFVLPGVKVTLPDGLNDDGTFKNQIRTTTSVEVSNNINYGVTGIFRGSIVISPTYAGRSYKYMSCSSRYTIPPTTNGYILSENKTFQTDSSGNIVGVGTKMCCLVDYTCTDGVVTEWKPHFIDAVVNSNMSNISNAGRSFIAEMSTPSSKYKSWTIGATDTTYTAIANGYVCASAVSKSGNSYVDLTNSTAKLHSFSGFNTAGYWVSAFVPCKKGDVIRLRYANVQLTGETYPLALGFIYAEGEN